jgi:hypothetical protein
LIKEHTMAICPFAQSMPIGTGAGNYTAGPFRIVHHTTEGPTAAGAFSAYSKKNVAPHFTVDDNNIYQHTDTEIAGRSLQNLDGPPQTNRHSAIQIEVVGFAHLPKRVATLRNLARLCRWIEAQYGIPREWPSGYPKQAVNGKDPGKHNRDVAIWTSRAGHYGHCHVPENDHWDPAYSRAEIELLMADIDLLESNDIDEWQREHNHIEPTQEELDQAVSTMPGH